MSPKTQGAMAPTTSFMRSVCAGEILEDVLFPCPDAVGVAMLARQRAAIT